MIPTTSAELDDACRAPLDDAPAGVALALDVVKDVFAPSFELTTARSSRRRLARSRWYGLTRR
jgi:hypothetical protein